MSPCVASVEKTPITVYYKPTAAWKTVKMSYTIGTKTTNNVTMKSVCDGWYNATIPDTGGKNVKTAFTNGSDWDANGWTNGKGNGYWGDGDTLAVTGGQSIADVTPNCVAGQ